MCDYSITQEKTRPAVVEDKLVTHTFYGGTTGFISGDDHATAICLLPGTELAFDKPIRARADGIKWLLSYTDETIPHKVAIFRQINLEAERCHHDALELPDGRVLLLTALKERQKATVLQLPPAPKTADEAKAQTRVEVVE